MFQTDDATVRRVLERSAVWAFVGLSDDPTRTAYQMAEFLQARGRQIVPVHPRGTAVLGAPGYRRLADVPFPLDCVGVYRRTPGAAQSADEAVAVGARAVWFPIGVVDDDAAARVTAAGLDMVMDRCPKIEWYRLRPAA